MADHWKSIANLLGAPGVDEPEVETPAVEAAPKAAPVSQSSTPAKAPAATTAPVREESLRIETDVDVEVEVEVKSRPAEFKFDPHTPIPDEALSFKSSRSGSAARDDRRHASTAKAADISSTSPAARTFSEPSPPPAAEARREAQRMPDRFEPQAPAATPPPTPPKRKSSWESLANMFNIKVDRSKPADVVPPVEPHAPEPSSSDSSAGKRSHRASDDEQRLSIFSDQQASKSNPALDAMFGDTPPGGAKSRSAEWGKPRVIDDLGWDDEDKNVSKRTSFSEIDPPRSVDAKLVDADSERGEVSRGEEDEAPRRGRRRRRGRRGRGDGIEESLESPSSRSSGESSSVDGPRSWGGVDHLTEDEVLAGDDPWDEPANFELVQPSVQDELDEVRDDASDDIISSSGEVLRRSSRRRRRGRGRGGRDRETGEMEVGPADRPSGHSRPDSFRSPSSHAAVTPRSASSPRDSGEFAETLSFRSDRDDDDFSDSPKEFDSPRPASSTRRREGPDEEPQVEGREREERGSRSRRRGRGGSGQSEKNSGESRREPVAGGRGRATEGRVPKRPVDDEGPIEEDFDDISLGPDFDGEEDDASPGDGKHRSIPTWADSIQSLVDANMENRKRGDSRGGAPRGRPRGRR